MEYKQVQYKPGKVTQIIFNRPEYLNAQSYQMLAEADQAFTAAASDQNCGAIVLSGAGRAFSAGHDLGTEEEIQYCREHGLTVPTDGDLPKKVADMHEWFVKKTLDWRNCPKPTVAMVHGYCIYAGWMLAAIGAAVIVSALVAGGMLTIGLVGAGGLWLALGLGHALATPPRD